MSTRWRKMLRDVSLNPGRFFMMTLAISTGVFAVTSIVTCHALLDRELNKSYLDAVPPSAILDVDPLDREAVAIARRQAGISWAQAAGSSTGKIETEPQQWLPILMFVTADFGAQRIGKLSLDSGRWPDQAGEIAIERTAVSLSHAVVGHSVKVQMRPGQAMSLRVTAIVHDSSVAPAMQQQVVYGYVSPETERLAGNDSAIRHLAITVAETRTGRPSVDDTILAVARELRDTGHRVGEIRIPPRQHPHWGIMQNIIAMLLAFGTLTMLLSSILAATLTANLLAAQARQIAIMKALGARRSQILPLYATLIGAIGMVAVLFGLPLGVYAGRSLAIFVAHNQNIDLTNLVVPTKVYCLIALTGAGLPLVYALLPIHLATRRTVRDSLARGISAPPCEPRTGSPLAATCRRSPAFGMAIRNTTRRRGRLALTLGLMAMAGALFTASLTVSAAWSRELEAAKGERRYDAEVHFYERESITVALDLVGRLPGVRRVEPFDEDPASLRRIDGMQITRTFPDGGHNSLRLVALPFDSAFAKPLLLEGRWLSRTDSDAAVVNQQALRFFPNATVGDVLSLTVRGSALDLRVVGVVREHLAGAIVYAPWTRLADTLANDRLTSGLRIGLDPSDESSRVAVIEAIERALDNAGLKVAATTSRDQLGRGLAGHLSILIFILLAMASLMALVGGLALGSALATGVLERRGELAVMRALGATNTALITLVMAEGVIVAVSSVVLTGVLSVPLTWEIARLVGPSMVGPASSVIAPGGETVTAIAFWLAIATTIAAIASAYPARQASRTTVREGLNCE